MKVWVVTILEYTWDGDSMIWIDRVFATEELAREYCTKNNYLKSLEYEYEEYEVQCV
jgi:hypothetical protein